MNPQKLAPAIHLVVDGWTAPLVASFLGLVVVWCEKGVLHRIVLEFIRCSKLALSCQLCTHPQNRLKKKHTGQYLAQEIAGCLKCYGIAHLVSRSPLFTLLPLTCLDSSFRW